MTWKYFSLLALCEVIQPVGAGFPSQSAGIVELDVFFGVRMNQLLNKQLSCLLIRMP